MSDYVIIAFVSGVFFFAYLMERLDARRTLKQTFVKNVGEMIENLKDEHNEQLATLIASLSKRYPEVSFAKLSRIAVAVSRWEVKRMTEIAEEELKRADRCKDLSDAAAEQKEYTFWDGYGACAEYLKRILENEKVQNHDASQDDI